MVLPLVWIVGAAAAAAATRYAGKHAATKEVEKTNTAGAIVASRARELEKRIEKVFLEADAQQTEIEENIGNIDRYLSQYEDELAVVDTTKISKQIEEFSVTVDEWRAKFFMGSQIDIETFAENMTKNVAGGAVVAAKALPNHPMVAPFSMALIAGAWASEGLVQYAEVKSRQGTIKYNHERLDEEEAGFEDKYLSPLNSLKKVVSDFERLTNERLKEVRELRLIGKSHSEMFPLERELINDLYELREKFSKDNV